MGGASLDIAAYVYPWDVVGDPAAPEVLAGLGLDHVTVAAFYHATRTLTPRHPGHRVVVADHSAAYLPLDGKRWADAALRPPAQTWVDDRDAFGSTVSALGSVGLPVHAWVVVSHIDPPFGTGPDPVVVNAYGDRYPWALCPARAEAKDYAVRLAAEVAARPDVSGVEFEACGWYGFDHLHAHDKVAGVRFGEVEQFLMSLCFCAGCDAAYRAEGVDPGELRGVVRGALDRRFSGGLEPVAGAESETRAEDSTVVDLLGADLAGAVLAMRGTVADALRDAVVRTVREQRPKGGFPIVFHGDPRPYRSTAFTGLDVSALPAGADGVVVHCWQEPTAAIAALRATGGPPVLASIVGVAGFGADFGRVSRIVEATASAGASGFRIYHAGLASAADLSAIRTLVQSARSRDEGRVAPRG